MKTLAIVFLIVLGLMMIGKVFQEPPSYNPPPARGESRVRPGMTEPIGTDPVTSHNYQEVIIVDDYGIGDYP